MPMMPLVTPSRAARSRPPGRAVAAARRTRGCHDAQRPPRPHDRYRVAERHAEPRHELPREIEPAGAVEFQTERPTRKNAPLLTADLHRHHIAQSILEHALRLPEEHCARTECQDRERDCENDPPKTASDCRTV